MKLDPSIDPAAWDAFLADYFAAAARLVAPYDHVRLRTYFRIEVGTKADRDHPVTNEYEERLTLLRSEPFARVRHRVDARGASGRPWPIPTTRSTPSANSPNARARALDVASLPASPGQG